MKRHQNINFNYLKINFSTTNLINFSNQCMDSLQGKPIKSSNTLGRLFPIDKSTINTFVKDQ